MNGLGIVAAGFLALFATAPGIPLLVLDLAHMHPQGREVIEIGPCVRARALARCIDAGGCNGG